MDPMATLMKNLGNPEVTTDLKQTIVDGVLQEAGNRSVKQLAKEENEMLLRLINLRTQRRSRIHFGQKGQPDLVKYYLTIDNKMFDY